MAKQVTTQEHNGINFSLHSTAVGKIKCGFACVPIFNSQEDIAELIENGWLTEKELCSHLKSAWAISEQARIRSLFGKKGSFSNEAMMTTMMSISSEQSVEIKAMETSDGIAELKRIWSENQVVTGVDTPDKIHWPLVPTKPEEQDEEQTEEIPGDEEIATADEIAEYEEKAKNEETN